MQQQKLPEVCGLYKRLGLRSDTKSRKQYIGGALAAAALTHRDSDRC